MDVHHSVHLCVSSFDNMLLSCLMPYDMATSSFKLYCLGQGWQWITVFFENAYHGIIKVLFLFILNLDIAWYMAFLCSPIMVWVGMFFKNVLTLNIKMSIPLRYCHVLIMVKYRCPLPTIQYSDAERGKVHHDQRKAGHVTGIIWYSTALQLKWKFDLTPWNVPLSCHDNNSLLFLARFPCLELLALLQSRCHQNVPPK